MSSITRILETEEGARPKCLYKELKKIKDSRNGLLYTQGKVNQVIADKTIICLERGVLRAFKNFHVKNLFRPYFCKARIKFACEL